jgi:hypothetical protein
LAVVALLGATAAEARISASDPPRRGTDQRAAILNAVRPSIEAEFGPGIEFVPYCVKVWKGWALLTAEPRRKGGRKIEPRAQKDWDDNIGVDAVLRFRQGRWTLLKSAIGSMDIWYDGFAPRALIDSHCY